MGLNTIFGDRFRGKKIFLTGHTGFKGSWLGIWLQMLHADIKGYSLAPHDSSLFNLIKDKLTFESVIADIRDEDTLEKEILSFRPDFIFHLAAQPLVIESYRYPVETFNTNITGTVNLLNAVRKLQNKCSIVIITTDKVYQNKELSAPYTEIDALGGSDPYSASEAATEIVIHSFRQSFFNPDKYSQHNKAVASARAGNVIGGGDFAKDRIIPDYVRSVQNNAILKIRNPKSVRPWQHILEPLSGYLQLAKMLDEHPFKYSSAFNFGPDSNDILTVRDLINESIKVFQKGAFEIEQNDANFHEAGLLTLDISKAKKELNWVPKYSSLEAIALTMKWYKEVLLDKQDAFETCENDILSFTNQLKVADELC